MSNSSQWVLNVQWNRNSFSWNFSVNPWPLVTSHQQSSLLMLFPALSCANLSEISTGFLEEKCIFALQQWVVQCYQLTGDKRVDMIMEASHNNLETHKSLFHVSRIAPGWSVECYIIIVCTPHPALSCIILQCSPSHVTCHAVMQCN